MLVEYSHCFQFRHDARSGANFPILTFDLVNPNAPDSRASLDAYLDSGCSRSLFDGRLAVMIGVDPTRGRRVTFASATGVNLTGTVCPVRLEHPAFGSFNLEVGFAQIHLSRNLLGRDFMAHVQLGLREYRQEFYLTPEP